MSDGITVKNLYRKKKKASWDCMNTEWKLKQSIEKEREKNWEWLFEYIYCMIYVCVIL